MYITFIYVYAHKLLEKLNVNFVEYICSTDSVHKFIYNLFFLVAMIFLDLTTIISLFCEINQYSRIEPLIEIILYKL